jgi:hypothetical protein
MAPTATADAKADRLLEIIKPYLLQLLRDAPDFGEITLGANIHDGDIGQVSLSAKILRKVAPRVDRGQQ